MPISEKQRRHLKGLAHHLKPVVMVGQHGLTESVLNETALTLETHELIKMRINAGDRQERAGIIAEITEKTGAELVQTIGHIAVFYLPNSEKQKIRLPG
ncbi:MAG: ribosome assembly RNA-binding protein YhbY [Gammaproteobacteria bacterium]|nr:ribosome assembly RNA-binding protein YhbY [Gammaproteobacteria bacterium]MCP5441735.1 ribosome assembly RNA-binding protein YhbY [Chromatiaceae bacterium]